MNPDIPTGHWNPHGNIVKRPGVKKLFEMLLSQFHVAIWSKMPCQKLRPLLAHILQEEVIQRLSFIFSREDLDQKEKFPWSYKMSSIVCSKMRSRDVCKPNQVLFVDVSPVSLRRTPDHACYIPWPFVGEVYSPTKSGVIPNVATDILPLIYPLHKFESVREYMKHAQRPGQMHYEIAQAVRLTRKCVDWGEVVW